MDKWQPQTRAIAYWMQLEGLGKVSDVSPPTFYIEKTKRSKVECVFRELSAEINLSDACLCSDFMVLCIINKRGDNVLLLKTEEVKQQMVGDSLDLKGIVDIIVKKWQFNFNETE